MAESGSHRGRHATGRPSAPQDTPGHFDPARGALLDEVPLAGFDAPTALGFEGVEPLGERIGVLPFEAARGFDVPCPGRVRDLVASPDGRWVAAATSTEGDLEGSALRLFATGPRSWEEVGALRALHGFTAAAFAGDEVLIGRGDGALLRARPDQLHAARELGSACDFGPVGDLAASPDGATLYALALDVRAAPPAPRLTVWDLRAGRRLRALSWPARRERLALDPTGRWLAVTAPGGVEVWDARALTR